MSESVERGRRKKMQEQIESRRVKGEKKNEPPLEAPRTAQETAPSAPEGNNQQDAPQEVIVATPSAENVPVETLVDTPKDYTGLEAELKINAVGDLWFRDRDGRGVRIESDSPLDIERDRQEKEPDSDPLPGFPRFSRGMSVEEIPDEATRSAGALVVGGGEVPSTPSQEGGESSKNAPGVKKKRMRSQKQELSQPAPPLEAVESTINASETSAQNTASEAATEAPPTTVDPVPERQRTPQEAIRQARARIEPVARLLLAQIEAGLVDPTRAYLMARKSIDAGDIRTFDEMLIKEERARGVDLGIQFEAAAPAERLRHLQQSSPLARALERVRARSGSEGGSKWSSGAPTEEVDVSELPGQASEYYKNTKDPEKTWMDLHEEDYEGITPFTMENIMSEPTSRQLFGELLYSLDKHHSAEVLAKLHSGAELLEDDRQFLYLARLEFTKIDAKFTYISETFTPEVLKSAMESDSSLAAIVTNVDVEDAHSQYIKGLVHLAMRDRGVFERFERALRDATEGDPAVRAKEEKLHRRMGIFSRFKGMRDAFDQVVQDRVRAKKDLAILLGEEYLADKEFRKNLERKAIFGEAYSAPRVESGPQSYPEAEGIKETFTKEKLQEYFDRDMSTYEEEGVPYSELPPVRKRAVSMRWRPKELISIVTAPGGGVWAQMERAIARLVFSSQSRSIDIFKN